MVMPIFVYACVERTRESEKAGERETITSHGGLHSTSRPPHDISASTLNLGLHTTSRPPQSQLASQSKQSDVEALG